jgi:hypothetical protein
VFAARVPEASTGLSEPGDGSSLSLMARAPGTVPSHVNPPKAPSDNLLMGTPEPPKLAAAPAPTPAAAPTRVANAAPPTQNDGFFSNLARKVGIGGAADATASTPPSKPKAPEAKQTAPRPEASAPKSTAPKADAKHAAASRPPLKPSVDTPAPAAKDNLVSGSAPIVSSNSFDSRFGAVK